MVFTQVLVAQTAGDPMQEGVTWTNLTRAEIASALAEEGYRVSVTVVDRLLDMHKMGLRKAEKAKPLGSTPDRDAQFRYIARLREEYLAAGDPVLSLDTKKREILGEFARPGRIWTSQALAALDHDFLNRATGVLVPQGLYDLGRNEGYLELGTSHDTSDFVADALWGWWCEYGHRWYRQSLRMLLLCDSGGSQSCRRWRFKEVVQEIADATGRDIRVAHYPTYCSKFNPIEHRMFPYVTKAWRGVLLTSPEMALELLDRATTQTGFKVHGYIRRTDYPHGVKASPEFRQNLPIQFDEFLPKWNYRAFSKDSPN